MRRQVQPEPPSEGPLLTELFIPDDPPPDAPHPAGTVVTFTLGAEKFSPVQYQTFDVGPFSASTTLRSGETIKGAYERVMGELRAVFKAEFEVRLREHLERVKAAGASARGGR